MISIQNVANFFSTNIIHYYYFFDYSRLVDFRDSDWFAFIELLKKFEFFSVPKCTGGLNIDFCT